VQAGLLRDLNTRVVVPLIPVAEAPRPAARLNPVLTVAGEPVVMVTQFLSAVPASLLRGGPVSLSGEAVAIGNALGLLLTGV
jgi:toxin CcdB